MLSKNSSLGSIICLINAAQIKSGVFEYTRDANIITESLRTIRNSQTTLINSPSLVMKFFSEFFNGRETSPQAHAKVPQRFLHLANRSTHVTI